MLFNQIKEGAKYIVSYSLKDLHFFVPGSTVTVEKIKSRNQIACTGFDKHGNEIFQHLFPEHLIEIPNTKNKTV